MENILETNNTNKTTSQEKNKNALANFKYENGFVFCGTDLGNQGVKIELMRNYENGGAIILPPNKALECAHWMLQSIGQLKHDIPKELPGILEKIATDKQARRLLNREDKKTIKQAISFLKIYNSKN